MRILGVDPGLITSGYGVIDAQGRVIRLHEAGIIRTLSRHSLQDRLLKIYDDLTEIIEETSPEIAVVEKLYSHYRHPTTAILMGHVRGAVYLAIRKKRLALFEYPVKRINMAIIGRGNAAKEQIARMVQAYLDLKELPKSLDVSDALALAIAHVFISSRQRI